ncbi:hypothetical protein [Gymnodinialimonas ulvae]|uniref:hypothetical protein n=1 Tax=Gymnodinialimonas ulvae TaxID=3126504 RepID=UPI00309F29D5
MIGPWKCGPMPMRATLILAICVLPGLATGQVVRECDTFEANARNLAFLPNSRPAVDVFANGDVWTIGLDTLEPACCSAHLMVNYFTELEPFPICALVSASEGVGFSGLRHDEMTATYDPSVGVTLTLPAGRYDGSASVMSRLVVTVNRATATVTAHHE